MAIECECDLLALCTSRPQGYSGQFSSLDASTLDLVELSAEQALACAKPVLSIDHSQEDVEQFMRVLTDATQSDAVRQLMTTPLQSHIMALLVRNGGRPPERRWKLFSNFYEVIKQRETNRKLPDERIAKLFRENDQLIKTVHNRLGFVLHSRAETSEGAQTQLTLNGEFKSLVMDVVARMIGEDTEQTVDVVMEATTERLVLVNTPDNGNYVRYDIRPLQEFFAAEFLYESIDATCLGQRVQIIRADAHWREVMYFLLSALVEDKRTTELTVVLEALRHLDEAAAEHNLLILKQRLGRGALLAARLLSEGVLEQNNSMREQFRRCLEPLSACVLPAILEPLLRTKQPRTQHWLCNTFADRIRDATEAESIGAAIVLVHMLPDDNPRVEEVQNALLTASSNYLLAVLQARINAARSYSNFVPLRYAEWTLNLCIKILVQSPSDTLNSDIVLAAATILCDDTERAIQIAKSNDMSAAHISLIELFLKDRDISIVGDSSKYYGLVRVGYCHDDWTMNKGSSGLLDLKEGSDAPGILQLVYRVIRFGRTHDYNDFISAYDYIKEYGKDYFLILPTRIQTYFPFDDENRIDKSITLIDGLSKKLFDELIDFKRIKGQKISRPYASIKIKSEWNDEDFLKAFELFPSLIHYFIENIIVYSRRSGSREICQAILTKGLQEPEIFLRIPQVWGLLIAFFPERQEEFRQKLLSVAAKPVIFHYRGGAMHPLEIRLPRDAPLLPHLLNKIILGLDVSFRYQTYTNHTHANSQKIIENIRNTVNDISELDLVAKDPAVSPLIRGCAALMHILHPSGTHDIGRWHQTLAEAYNSQTSLWFLDCFATTALLISSENDLETQRIVAKLLDLSRTDYKGRQSLERLLASWREVSDAPINKAGVLDTWLNEG